MDFFIKNTRLSYPEYNSFCVIYKVIDFLLFVIPIDIANKLSGLKNPESQHQWMIK